MGRVLRHGVGRDEAPIILDIGDGSSVETNQLPNRPTFAKLGTERGDVIECANTPDKSDKRIFEVYQSSDGAERLRAYHGHTVPAARPAAHGNPVLQKFLLLRGSSIQADSEIVNAGFRAIGGGGVALSKHLLIPAKNSIRRTLPAGRDSVY